VKKHNSSFYPCSEERDREEEEEGGGRKNVSITNNIANYMPRITYKCWMHTRLYRVLVLSMIKTLHL
jgi:hypothetical protein